ncbi:hypothetical protein F5985_03480 [Malikia spinosa]|uniref:DNA-directed DNA polymerase n=1 Tax=Malikia spinosa TaxID=86180 RepID=A0A7C9N7H9_9BURK|nr:hypothetical protein [Malikia spinosa]
MRTVSMCRFCSLATSRLSRGWLSSSKVLARSRARQSGDFLTTCSSANRSSSLSRVSSRLPIRFPHPHDAAPAALGRIRTDGGPKQGHGSENFSGLTYGLWLYRASHGLDEHPVVTHSEPVSMSRETTFDRNLHVRRDREELGQALTRLCEQVAADLQRRGYVGRTIGIKIRFDDFMTVTRDLTFPQPISEATALRRAAGKCLLRVDLTRTIRLLGVRASALERADALKEQPPEQMTLDLG